MQEELTKYGVFRITKDAFEQFGFVKGGYIYLKKKIYSYNTNFEKVGLVLEILLNEDGKIETIQFRESK